MEPITAMGVLKFLIGFGVNLQGVSLHIHWMLLVPLMFAGYRLYKWRIDAARKKV